MSRMKKDFDLNINNYNLNDLTNLFGVSLPLQKEDLKTIYKRTLMTHPDKSGLDKKYFLFFKEAFQILKKVYEHYNKSLKDYSNHIDNNIVEERFKDVYSSRRLHHENGSGSGSGSGSELTLDLEYNRLSHIVHDLNKQQTQQQTQQQKKDISKQIDRSKMTSSQIREFNDRFNQLFMNVRIHDEEQDSHYDDWWMNENENDNKNKTISNVSQMNEAIYHQKRMVEQQAIQEYKGIQELSSTHINSSANGTSISSILREKPAEYSSDLFSKLKYEDLRKAHLTETVVPVTEEEVMRQTKVYSTVNHLKLERNMNIPIPSEAEMKQQLKEKQIDEMKTQLDMFYKLGRQMEQIEEANKKWNSQFYMLTQ
jgi:hypothetical protein